MKRTVYLEGELEQFGKSFVIDADKFKDVFNCLDCNIPEFRKYMLTAVENGVNFVCEVEGEALDSPDQLLLNAKPGDMTIYALPAGSSSGAGKIMAAIAVVAIMYFIPVAGGNLLTAQGLGSYAAFAQLAGYGLAVNLALAGIQQIMAPDPATDSQPPESYLFNGSEQNIVEGDPVAILYGRLRVPGRPISFQVSTANKTAMGLDAARWGFDNYTLNIQIP